MGVHRASLHARHNNAKEPRHPAVPARLTAWGVESHSSRQDTQR